MNWRQRACTQLPTAASVPPETEPSYPTNALQVIGITGTNGKTTVAYLIGEVLKAAGHKPFVLGTYNSGDRDLTTPKGPDIEKFMQAHVERGGTHFIMEVTSEGIDQGRIAGIEFDIKILTNITRDHLDYHVTFENYERTKLSFMSSGQAHKIFPTTFCDETINFSTQLFGTYNKLNVKAAAAALRHMNVPERFISETLSRCPSPPGRLECVDAGQPYLVLVDYAHTPDGLENVLVTLKELAISRGGRLLVLFGCGGDRDRGKRPDMGRIASSIADVVIVADDNPRTESSRDIMVDILGGLRDDFDDFSVIKNRKTAIEFAVSQCRSEDVLLLAGKGHESSQILRSGTVDFDDRKEAAVAIRNQTNRKNILPFSGSGEAHPSFSVSEIADHAVSEQETL